MAKIIVSAALLVIAVAALASTVESAPAASAAQPAPSASTYGATWGKTQKCATVNGATVCVWQ